MPTYEEIGDAFGSYCEASWKLHDQLRNIALALKSALQKTGNIPDDKFGFASGSEDFDASKTYGPRDSIKYEPEKECWSLAYFIEVKRIKDIFPSEILIFTVLLNRDSSGFTLKLEFPKKFSVSIPNDAKSEDVAHKTEVMSERILEDILEYYKQGETSTRVPPDRDKRRIIGFGIKAT